MRWHGQPLQMKIAAENVGATHVMIVPVAGVVIPEAAPVPDVAEATALGLQIPDVHFVSLGANNRQGPNPVHVEARKQ